jgi:phosphoribosylformylglycinamidine synthase subunit PurS
LTGRSSVPAVTVPARGGTNRTSLARAAGIVTELTAPVIGRSLVCPPERNAAAGSRTLRDVARVVVDVMLKPEIHDPQGEAIASAGRRLGFGQILGVRQGKRFELEIPGPADEAAVARIAELAAELLANPVIEEFEIHAQP